MSNKNDFFKLWGKYLKNQKLNEASEDAINAISRASDAAFRDPSLLPFNSIFGDKLRIVQPLEQKNVDKVAMILAAILSNLSATAENGYNSANINANRVTKKMKQKPLGWVEGQPIPEVEKQIVELNVNIPKLSTNPETKEVKLRFNNTTVIGALKEVAKAIRNNIQKDIDSYVETYKEQPPAEEPQAFSGRKDMDANRIFTHKKKLQAIPSLAKWWQENQGRFILDPELLLMAKEKAEAERYAFDITTFDSLSDQNVGEVENKYSIIYSRVPVDILRMSDFEDEGLESCHSEGNDYFTCALAEAQNEGAIAYAIKTEDLENIDLDDREIFYDRRRRIEGIAPVARVRLRNITDVGTGIAIAVPSSRIYGERLDNFLNTVKKFALDKQADELITTDEEGNRVLNISTKTSEFAHRGGSYEDSPGIGTGFITFIEELTKQEKVEPSPEQQELLKNIRYSIRNITREREFTDWSTSDDDDEDEMAREEAENLFDRGLRRVRDNTTLSVDGCDFEWEYGDGPSILALFELEYNINMSEFTPEYGADVDDSDVESDILDRLRNKSDDIFTYPDVSLARVRSFVRNNTRTIVVVYEDTYYSADEFFGVCNDLVRWIERNNEEQLEKTFMEVLKENGILKVADNESVGVRFRNFARYIGNSSNYFDTEIRGSTVGFTFSNKQNKSNAKQFLVAKLDPIETGAVFSSFAPNHRKVDQNGNIIINDQVALLFAQNISYTLKRLILNMPTVSTDKVKQEKLPFAEEDNDNILDDYSFQCDINMNVSGEHLRSVSSGLADNTSMRQRYDVYLSSIKFTFNYKQDQDKINQFENLIEKINDDPQFLLDKFYEAFRITFQSYYSEERAAPIIAALDAIKAEKESQSSLTESKKKIIKERLLSWYRRNKGNR